MTDGNLSFARQNMRGCDVNSLLRMYDAATEVLKNARLQQDKTRANKAIQRIGDELRRRNISPGSPL